MKEYQKIPTVYKRATDGSKRIKEGDYCSREVEYLADNNWFFTEKIDGTNTEDKRVSVVVKLRIDRSFWLIDQFLRD